MRASLRKRKGLDGMKEGKWGVWTNRRYTQQRREGRARFQLETKVSLPVRVRTRPYRYLDRMVNTPELWVDTRWSYLGESI